MREDYVSVPGGKVFVKTWMPHTPLSTIPIILLHDSLGCVALWREFPAILSERLKRPVVAYDRLGFGQSTARVEIPSVNFVTEEAEIYFPAIYEYLRCDRFDLWGHCVGGGMAVAIAARFPQACRSVVTEASQAFVEERTREGIRKAKASFAHPSQIEKLRRYHGDKAEWVLAAWTEVWLSSEFASWSLKDLLPQVRCALLAIHGDRDEYGSLAFPEMIVQLAGGKSQKFIVENCGHVPHREWERLVLDEIKELLGV